MSGGGPVTKTLVEAMSAEKILKSYMSGKKIPLGAIS
jgi:hypothetical protein